VSVCTLWSDYNDSHHWGFNPDSNIHVQTDTELQYDLDIVESELGTETGQSESDSQELWPSDRDLFDDDDDKNNLLDSDVDLFD
jgi:hypothetical protein